MYETICFLILFGARRLAPDITRSNDLTGRFAQYVNFVSVLKYLQLKISSVSMHMFYQHLYELK